MQVALVNSRTRTSSRGSAAHSKVLRAQVLGSYCTTDASHSSAARYLNCLELKDDQRTIGRGALCEARHVTHAPQARSVYRMLLLACEEADQQAGRPRVQRGGEERPTAST